MSIIVPAILTDDLNDFSRKLKLIEDFPKVEAVHIDFADGRFVPNSTVMPAAVPNLPIKYVFTAHLMIKDPGQYISDLQRAGFEIISFHYESVSGEASVRELIKNIREAGLEPQIAVNPQTSIESLSPLLSEVSRVHVMTVEPGWQGSKYIPGEGRIKFLRDKDFYGTIVVDGGINRSNARSLLAAGADVLVVGSFIFRDKNPKQAYLELLQEVGETV